jgi:4-amino-4-deoxychorismate lyase
MAPLKVLIDGREQWTVHATDRGLHYGDGLFETMAVRAGAPRHWQRHLARLASGCQRLALPLIDPAILWQEATSLCAGVDAAVLKLIYTRGIGGRGYRPEPAPASRLLMLYPAPSYPPSYWSAGVSVGVCRTAIGISPALAGLKHLNRLEQVLARAEWDDPEVPEGLMLDTRGRIIEGTQTNVFMVKAGRLLTPDLTESGVAGVARGLILEQAARLGLHAEVRPLTLEDAKSADELFLCNSLIGIWPVRTLEQVRYAETEVTERLISGLSAAGLL